MQLQKPWVCSAKNFDLKVAEGKANIYLEQIKGVFLSEWNA